MKSKTKPISKSTSDASGSDDAARIEQIKLDLLSLVSHELRTPLSSVLNALRIIREGAVSGKQREEFLDMAFRNAERLNSTLNQLLDLSKLASGRLVCRFQEVSLKQVVHAELERARESFTKSGRELSVAGVEKLPVILGDALRLEKVICSALENAARFSPQGSKTEVRIRLGNLGNLGNRGKKMSLSPQGEPAQSREFVTIEITNMIDESAAKLDPQEILRIFGQQEAVLARAHEGVGGSLAISAEVLRQHGGALHVSIEKGDKSRFTVLLGVPHLDSEAAVLKALEARLFALRAEVGAISTMILDVGGKNVKLVHKAIREALFRASDTAYGLGKTGQVIVLMDDCKKQDAPKIVRRLLRSLGPEMCKPLANARYGLSSSPEDGTDPAALLEHARRSFVTIAELRRSRRL